MIGRSKVRKGTNSGPGELLVWLSGLPLDFGHRGVPSASSSTTLPWVGTGEPEAGKGGFRLPV